MGFFTEGTLFLIYFLYKVSIIHIFPPGPLEVLSKKILPFLYNKTIVKDSKK